MQEVEKSVKSEHLSVELANKVKQRQTIFNEQKKDAENEIAKIKLLLETEDSDESKDEVGQLKNTKQSPRNHRPYHTLSDEVQQKSMMF